MNRPFLVGVTGGIGSGKSTVCRFLAERGCALFEADRVAGELQCRDPAVIAGIRRLFGHDIYSVGAGGELRLDRRRIACEVFADPDKLRMLNDVVHPAVFEAFRLMCEKARHEDTAVLVKEAAILFEAGRADELDLVAVVVAADEIRVKRAVERGVGSREEILRRMALQWPQERLIELAGYVLWNEGSLDRLRQETEKLHAFILERAGELSGNCR